jgi:hypothetical protein
LVEIPLIYEPAHVPTGIDKTFTVGDTDEGCNKITLGKEMFAVGEVLLGEF